MSPGEAGRGIHAALWSLEAYRHASPAARATACAAAHMERVHSGAVLYREGEAVSDLAVVVSGRLRASRRRRSPTPSDSEYEILSDMVPGDIVGELAALTDAPRSADVVAVRETTGGPADHRRPPVARHIEPCRDQGVVSEVVRRVDRERPASPAASPSVVCVVDLSSGSTQPGAVLIADALRSVGARVAVVDDVATVNIADLEASHDVVILHLVGHTVAAVHAAVNQADLVLVVADGPAGRHAILSRALEARAAHAAAAPWEAVLVHGDTVVPIAAGWRLQLDLTAVHHVRTGSPSDAMRLGRRLVGSSVGLVISGGGARALAALGVARVMKQRGIPIDYVGGSSIGALMAVLLATDRPPDDLIDAAATALRRADWGGDFTLPLLSLLSIRNAIPAIDALLGGVDLLDTPIPCFVTSVDLTECCVVIHDQGCAARWVRASASPPGLWPPVIGDDGHFHVDGGVLDNLPIDPMRRRGANMIIAVNVTVAPPFALEPGSVEARSWVDLIRQRRRGMPYPGVTDLLFRMGIVGSLPAQRRAAELADVLVRPDVAHVALADYEAAPEVVAAGERAAIRSFDEHPIHTFAGARAAEVPR